MQQRNYLLEALAQSRTRQSWNDRLTHWERPASDSEEAMIERAAATVRALMSKNRWFAEEGVQVAPQGSYYNNTNVRLESDLDIRAVHPLIRAVYANDVIVDTANAVLQYNPAGRDFLQVAEQMRSEMAAEFMGEFGVLNVDASGNKAIRVNGVPGSRAPVDVVPCFQLHYVQWNPAVGRYFVTKGNAIFSRGNGRLTMNFPDQHHENGVQKRARTQLRFKRNVRMLKRLRDELVESRVFGAEEVPSFLVECLVYGVEDQYFLVETDDRYDRLVRIVTRIYEQLGDPTWVSNTLEINEVKFLFRPDQGWTAAAAKRFTAAAWNRLMG
jgi:hypothetical protein